jgi:hypothetical protein
VRQSGKSSPRVTSSKMRRVSSGRPGVLADLAEDAVELLVEDASD